MLFILPEESEDKILCMANIKAFPCTGYILVGYLAVENALPRIPRLEVVITKLRSSFKLRPSIHLFYFKQLLANEDQDCVENWQNFKSDFISISHGG